MKLCAEYKSDVLYLQLDGELDEHNAARLRMDADRLADDYATRLSRAVIDLQNVSFMDSTGIGFLIGRYKKFSRYGIPVYVTNLSATTDKILQMSGVYSIIPKL